MSDWEDRIRNLSPKAREKFQVQALKFMMETIITQDSFDSTLDTALKFLADNNEIRISVRKM